MEQINLNNYEAFFLDFIEGNLDAAGEASLHSFLANNPDILNEFNELLTDQGMAELKLQANSVPTFDKKALLIDESIISFLTVDHWMCSKVEGLLNEQEAKALAHFVKEHKLDTKMAAYEAAILVAGAEGYGNKRDLKRKDGIVIPLYAKFTAAAAVGALLMGLFFTQNPTNPLETANNNLIESVKELAGKRTTYVYGSKVFESESKNSNYISSDKSNEWNDLVVELPVDVIKPDSSTYDSSFDLKDDQISHQPTDKDTVQIKVIDKNNDPFEEEDIVLVENVKGSVVEEEPFRIITNAAGNLMNRDIHYVRNLNTETDQYVAHHFKIGKFEFERKKAK
jgi:hypothetical protein